MFRHQRQKSNEARDQWSTGVLKKGVTDGHTKGGLIVGALLRA